ncbi:hypothetical protein DSECCO2_623520 [anaerobic digester metagenome]
MPDRVVDEVVKDLLHHRVSVDLKVPEVDPDPDTRREAEVRDALADEVGRPLPGGRRDTHVLVVPAELDLLLDLLDGGPGTLQVGPDDRIRAVLRRELDVGAGDGDPVEDIVAGDSGEKV